ncbi:GH116 family glycosyl hydrolase [Synechocystis salina]
MIQMGKKEEALKMTETVVNQVYSNGLQFRTPEAITAVGTFRASHYLRAMAIWAVYGLLEGFANLPIAPADDEVPTSDFY